MCHRFCFLGILLPYLLIALSLVDVAMWGRQDVQRDEVASPKWRTRPHPFIYCSSFMSHSTHLCHVVSPRGQVKCGHGGALLEALECSLVYKYENGWRNAGAISRPQNGTRRVPITKWGTVKEGDSSQSVTISVMFPKMVFYS